MCAAEAKAGKRMRGAAPVKMNLDGAAGGCRGRKCCCFEGSNIRAGKLEYVPAIQSPTPLLMNV